MHFLLSHFSKTSLNWIYWLVTPLDAWRIDEFTSHSINFFLILIHQLIEIESFCFFTLPTKENNELRGSRVRLKESHCSGRNFHRLRNWEDGNQNCNNKAKKSVRMRGSSFRRLFECEGRLHDCSLHFNFLCHKSRKKILDAFHSSSFVVNWSLSTCRLSSKWNENYRIGMRSERKFYAESLIKFNWTWHVCNCNGDLANACNLSGID